MVIPLFILIVFKKRGENVKKRRGRNGETENGRLKDLETCFWAIRNLHKQSFRVKEWQ